MGVNDMKIFTPILIILLIIGVVSVSGCITFLDSENNTQTDTSNHNPQNSNINMNKTVVNVNNSGNIKIGTEESSKNIKKINSNKAHNQTPKISKEEIEKEVVRIMKLNNLYLNFTSKATLIYDDKGTPFYIVDVYDDYGWCAFFEINANSGPTGNDKDGYSFDGGAVRGETGDEPTPIDGIMPKISHNKAKKILDKELYTNYSINEASYRISGFVENNTPFYNISIEEFDEDNVDRTYERGNIIMNANTGEIMNVSLKNKTNTVSNKTEKVYSVDEAGDYIDIMYKGKKVSVRENYPYYSPQNDKIYYSQEEEAEDLIKHYDDFD